MTELDRREEATVANAAEDVAVSTEVETVAVAGESTSEHVQPEPPTLETTQQDSQDSQDSQTTTEQDTPAGDVSASPSSDTPPTADVSDATDTDATDTTDATTSMTDVSEVTASETAETAETAEKTDEELPSPVAEETTTVAEASDTTATEELPSPVVEETTTVAEASDTTATEELPSPVVEETTTVAEASDTTATTEAGEPESSVEEAAPSEEAGATFTPVAAQETRPRRLKDLEVGMELEGRVTSVALYGIFVDIGVGRDGLVHISEMSDTRIDSPSDIVQIGDTVKVRIKSIDLEARRISLTMRSRRERDSGGGGGRGGSRKRAEIDRDALSNLKNGDTVDGTITGLAPFGAFVDIGVGKDGLVHISELSDSRVERPEDAVQVGDKYTFKLLDVDSEGNRISLSLRRAQRAQKLQKLEPGQILDGRVSGLAPFGAFVDIGVGRDGLVHISQLSEGRVEKVEDAVNVGDSVSVRVLEVDPQSKRISLSMRLEEPEEEPELEPQTPEINYGIYQTPRDDSRKDRRRGRSRSNTPQPPVEVYVSEDDSDEEEIEGDATLEDLVMKFNSNRRDRRRRSSLDEDDEENYGKRQRDAQRRTLRQLDDEDE